MAQGLQRPDLGKEEKPCPWTFLGCRRALWGQQHGTGTLACPRAGPALLCLLLRVPGSARGRPRAGPCCAPAPKKATFRHRPARQASACLAAAPEPVPWPLSQPGHHPWVLPPVGAGTPIPRVPPAPERGPRIRAGSPRPAPAIGAGGPQGPRPPPGDPDRPRGSAGMEGTLRGIGVRGGPRVGLASEWILAGIGRRVDPHCRYVDPPVALVGSPILTRDWPGQGSRHRIGR